MAKRGKVVLDRGGQQPRGGAGGVAHVLSADFKPGAQHDGPVVARVKAAGKAARRGKPSPVKVSSYPKNLQTGALAVHHLLNKGR